jgi:DNA-binding beta-propeller fold protein YncE
LLGDSPPFQGKTLEDLSASSTFLFNLILLGISLFGLFYILRGKNLGPILKIASLVFFALLAVLTTRTAVQAAYHNYDNANELLVYAHSAGGVKQALSQIEEISERTTGGNAIEIAYDNETSYPYWWYLRNYPNARYYGADPTRSLRDAPAILVGDANYGKIEPVVGQAYNQFQYIRLWWPNQDYYDLSWGRITDAISDPQMREALFQIWLNRDYTRYGEVTGKDTSLVNWSPSAKMRLYIRKDIVNQLWNYGSVPSDEPILADPYDGKEVALTPEKVFGIPGDKEGEFSNPRGIAIGPDGTIYITDTDNHRIQHLSQDGEVLNVWGSFGDVTTSDAPGGTFNQPWGIEIAEDGAVYVADTWNHRIQKFTADGEFITMWGYFGTGESPEAFWGPRDIALSPDGEVLVTDTGNKRVVIFDGDGNYLQQFGSAGFAPGQFDEPVGIDVDSEGTVFVADTWNQRIQVFVKQSDDSYTVLNEWEVFAWYGQSLDNKPFITTDGSGRVIISDPDGYRVIEFSEDGEIRKYWGDYGVDLNAFGMPSGVDSDGQGAIWVTDAANNRVMRFITNP